MTPSRRLSVCDCLARGARYFIAIEISDTIMLKILSAAAFLFFLSICFSSSSRDFFHAAWLPRRWCFRAEPLQPSLSFAHSLLFRPSFVPPPIETPRRRRHRAGAEVTGSSVFCRRRSGAFSAGNPNRQGCGGIARRAGVGVVAVQVAAGMWGAWCAVGHAGTGPPAR